MKKILILLLTVLILSIGAKSTQGSFAEMSTLAEATYIPLDDDGYIDLTWDNIESNSLGFFGDTVFGGGSYLNLDHVSTIDRLEVNPDEKIYIYLDMSEYYGNMPMDVGIKVFGYQDLIGPSAVFNDHVSEWSGFYFNLENGFCPDDSEVGFAASSITQPIFGLFTIDIGDTYDYIDFTIGADFRYINNIQIFQDTQFAGLELLNGSIYPEPYETMKTTPLESYIDSTIIQNIWFDDENEEVNIAFKTLSSATVIESVDIGGTTYTLSNKMNTTDLKNVNTYIIDDVSFDYDTFIAFVSTTTTIDNIVLDDFITGSGSASSVRYSYSTYDIEVEHTTSQIETAFKVSWAVQDTCIFFNLANQEDYPIDTLSTLTYEVQTYYITNSFPWEWWKPAVETHYNDVYVATIPVSLSGNGFWWSDELASQQYVQDFLETWNEHETNSNTLGIDFVGKCFDNYMIIDSLYKPMDFVAGQYYSFGDLNNYVFFRSLSEVNKNEKGNNDLLIDLTGPLSVQADESINSVIAQYYDYCLDVQDFVHTVGFIQLTYLNEFSQSILATFNTTGTNVVVNNGEITTVYDIEGNDITDDVEVVYEDEKITVVDSETGVEMLFDNDNYAEYIVPENAPSGLDFIADKIDDVFGTISGIKDNLISSYGAWLGNSLSIASVVLGIAATGFVIYITIRLARFINRKFPKKKKEVK